MLRHWVWVALAASLLGSCASEDLSSYEQGVLDICHGACVGFQRCHFSSEGCEEGCAAEYDPRGIRGESLAVVGECLKTEDCETLGGEKAFGPCFEQAAASEPLREELIAYCEAAAQAYFNCNIWWSVEECTQTMGAWNDDVLRTVALCFDQRCDDLDACQDATFENPP